MVDLSLTRISRIHADQDCAPRTERCRRLRVVPDTNLITPANHVDLPSDIILRPGRSRVIDPVLKFAFLGSNSLSDYGIISN